MPQKNNRYKDLVINRFLRSRVVTSVYGTAVAVNRWLAARTTHPRSCFQRKYTLLTASPGNYRYWGGGPGILVVHHRRWWRLTAPFIAGPLVAVQTGALSTGGDGDGSNLDTPSEVEVEKGTGGGGGYCIFMSSFIVTPLTVVMVGIVIIIINVITYFCCVVAVWGIFNSLYDW